MKQFALLLTCLLLSLSAKPQTANSDTTLYQFDYPNTEKGIQFSGRQLIAPATLVSLGVIGLLEKDLDLKTRDNIADLQGNTFIDDLLPFVSPGAVYVLNWSGIKGKHNFVDRTVLLGTSAILTGAIVYSIKHSVKRERPDKDGNDSFPSMHTAIAFMGAEFLRQEFGDQSIWYGIAGYTIASGTGFLRIYNNRHWLSDVLAGAGIGILSTQIAYWIYPEIRKLYAGSQLDGFQFTPYLSSTNTGIAFSFRF